MVKLSPDEQVSIETGYFVFTLMPSLYCKLRCPHCYLSLEQRKDATILSVDKVSEACAKIDAYYQKKRLERKTIVNYWYGGEPTSMGEDYFRSCADAIGSHFTAEKGYDIHHTVLTSLVGVDLDVWGPIFEQYGKGAFQTSFDGLMRGKGYMRVWDNRVREANARGLEVSTISVVNEALLSDGPVAVLDYLSDLSVAETSWLPFMLNEQNEATKKYDEFAPRMDVWSEFMIALSSRWLERKRAGLHAPEIGQLRFILRQRELGDFANIAGQTLFLMPNGDFVLPDYGSDSWLEYMQRFGNILEQDFEEVLRSPERRRYIRKQILRNGNPDCVDCSHSGYCVMEFWKKNRPGDDCFGGRNYVEWVLENEAEIRHFTGSGGVRLY
ncbi:SPASM domain-containing protein [Thalassospira xianhensis]|uniref:SPASM domain-containing protein n=1 Tax=Thalassospira xianhensis TaxID=478503 RepID=UPI000DED6526|nr:SPASM domain-containing protein [Thalassospira xianhensis]